MIPVNESPRIPMTEVVRSMRMGTSVLRTLRFYTGSTDGPRCWHPSLLWPFVWAWPSVWTRVFNSFHRYLSWHLTHDRSHFDLIVILTPIHPKWLYMPVLPAQTHPLALIRHPLALVFNNRLRSNPHIPISTHQAACRLALTNISIQ